MFFFNFDYILHLNLSVSQICSSILPRKQGEMYIRFVDLEIIQVIRKRAKKMVHSKFIDCNTVETIFLVY